MHVYNHILYLTLKIFSVTGGIEKVNRVMGKALYDLGLATGKKAKVYCMYDEQNQLDEKYFPKSMFKGFGENKLKFSIKSIAQGKKSNIVVLSHINLLSIGYLIKLLSPKTKLLLIAHGIEVWHSFSPRKKRMLNKCDFILPVSEFTKQKMIELNGIDENKFHVLNNCLDPYLAPPVNDTKSSDLLKRYGFKPNDKILMTLTRLSSTEKYKGYDNVLQSVKDLSAQDETIKYLIVGKCDAAEKERVDKLIDELNLNNKVTLAGFVPDEELAAHFNIADVYVMTSQKEGFGIVFIEAMYYGKPVIAGNKDGSIDALCNGKLGTLVNPDNQEEITNAIKTILANKSNYIPNKALVMEKFSFSGYKEKINKILFQANN